MRIVILISGHGSNLQAIIDAVAQGLPMNIAAVISNCADAYGLVRAQQADIATHIISHKAYRSRYGFEQALSDTIDRYHPELLVLAGFMRKLTSAFVNRYRTRILNIHPSLLPKYSGLNTHAQALAAQDTEHGATVHYVTEALDGGPIIAQVKLAIDPSDTVETLSSRVKTLEHYLYPEVLSWIVDGRLRLSAQGVFLDNQLLPESGSLLTLYEKTRTCTETAV